jgi:hypothetical protein
VIKEFKAVTVFCDGCSKDLCEGMDVRFIREHDLKYMMEDKKWRTVPSSINVRSQHYCPACYDQTLINITPETE